MPKKGGPGSRKSVRVEEKAALEAEQAAAVVDAQTAAKEAQAAADAAAEELAVYRAEVASAAEAAEQKAAAELAELKEQLEQAKRVGSPVRAGGRANPFEETPAPAPEGEEAFGTPLVRNPAAEGGSSPAPAPGPAVPAAAPDAAELLAETYIDPYCKATGGCYRFFGYLLPPVDRLASQARKPSDMRQW